MIELLTPPAKGEPASPGAKSGGGGPGGIDFAALFGSVAPAAAPTTDAVLPPASDGVVPAAATVPDTAPPAVPDLVTPSIDALSAMPAAPTAALPAVPAAAMPVDPTPAVVASVAVLAAAPETDDAPPATMPGSLAAKVTTIRPHSPVATEDETVKLPTLPAGFVAQKAPRTQQAAGGDADDKEETAADESAATPQAPVSAMPVIPAPAAADVATAAAAPASAANIATMRRGVAPTVKLADKTETAVKADPASTGTISDTQADAAPFTSLDSGPSMPVVMALTSQSGDQGAAAATPHPTLAPLFTAAAPVAAPIVDTSAIPVSTQRLVALDDLMVAGAGDSAWLDRLSSDITTLANGDSREAHMRLNPRSLGDMSIRLDMDGQSTRVHFTVETQAAATLISDSTQKLTSLVQANGLKLDGATVDLNQRRDDGRPSDQAQRQAEAPTNFTRARSEAARLIERTRIAVATERFA